MITGFLTFVFFFAIVGCVLYGRKLIKTEKVDAVFGNPERARSGLPNTASTFSVLISFLPYKTHPTMAKKKTNVKKPVIISFLYP